MFQHLFEPAVADDDCSSGVWFPQEVVEANLHGVEQRPAGLLHIGEAIPLAHKAGQQYHEREQGHCAPQHRALRPPGVSCRPRRPFCGGRYTMVRLHRFLRPIAVLHVHSW